SFPSNTVTFFISSTRNVFQAGFTVFVTPPFCQALSINFPEAAPLPNATGCAKRQFCFLYSGYAGFITFTPRYQKDISYLFSIAYLINAALSVPLASNITVAINK